MSVPRCCCRAATCCAGNLCFQQGPGKPLGDYERGGLRRFIGEGGDVASLVEHGRVGWLSGLCARNACMDWV